DLTLRRQVAIKLLPAHIVRDEERRLRLLREARALAAVTHPNIATIYEIGQDADVVFLAMELVEGKTLRSLLAGRPLPIDKALSIALGVTEGMARAHEARIVHRDLKPENIIVGTSGEVKILDFGLAKLSDDRAPLTREDLSAMHTLSGALTREGVILGTAAYMSPEQARGDIVDRRSDIFALGVTLYEMITGQLPFRGRTPTDILTAIIRDAPTPPSQSNRAVSPDLERIVMRCLEKDPGERYQEASDLTGELGRAKRQLDSADPPRAIPAPRSDDVQSRAAFIAPHSLLRPVLIGSGIVALAIALVVIVIWPRTPRFKTGARIILADFDNQTGDPALDTLVRDAFESMLGFSSLVHVVERTSSAATPGQGAASPVMVFDGSGAERLCSGGQCEGYATGEVTRAPQGLRLHVAIHQPGLPGRMLSVEKTVAGNQDIILGLHEIALEIRHALGEAPDSVAATRPPSTTSLAAFVTEQMGSRLSDLNEQLAHHKEAVRLDPRYADAWVGLAFGLHSTGRCKEGRDAAEHLMRLASELSGPARDRLEVYSLFFLEDFDGFEERVRVRYRRSPLDSEVLLDLAFLASEKEDFATSAHLLEQVYSLSPSYLQLRALGFAQLGLDDTKPYERLVAEYRGSGGNQTEINSLLLFSDLAHGDVSTMQHRWSALEGDNERIRGTSDWLYVSGLLSSGRLAEAEQTILASWRAGFNDRDLDRRRDTWLWKAWLETRRTGHIPSFSEEQLAIVRQCTRYLTGFALYSAETQRSDLLANLIRGYESNQPATPGRYPREEVQFARGCLEVGLGRGPEAVRDLEPLARASSLARRHYMLARGYELARNPRSAIAEYELALSLPGFRFSVLNPALGALAQVRLARQYESIGERESARKWYSSFLDAWKDADVGIPEVVQAKERLSALRAEGTN
ncbi:MAG TPA: serine/threonine-protein kinase, partial [Candidatus Polarisedimenticolia bacterium]|nr:serine/threonine-protein kinase [Candidatus Polarisedimenticolia bacterium]